MSRSSLSLSLIASAFLLGALQADAGSVVAAPAAAPDSGLYANYVFDATFANVQYQVCGSVPGSNGCYGSGTLGPFGKIGAMLDGDAVVDSVKNTVTRDVYVVDQAFNGGKTVKLVVFRMVETIAAPNATVTVNRVKTLTLPLTGGPKAKIFMGASDTDVFIASDQDEGNAMVAKSGFQVSGMNSAQALVSAFGTSVTGFVAIAHKDSEFELRGPDGGLMVAGADLNGNKYMVNQVLGLSRFIVPPTNASSPFSLAMSPPVRHAVASAPDSELSTLYDIHTDLAFAWLQVCGTFPGNPNTEGCGFRTDLGAFGRIGALVEGHPTYDDVNHTVSRDIYVVDQSVNGGSATRLYVYRLVETLDPVNGLNTVITKVKTVPLPLKGGPNAHTFLAATSRNLFIGTDQTSGAAIVDKSGFAVTPFGSGAVASITADPAGFATVDFVGGGFESFKPAGSVDSSGGGTWYLLNTRAGITTSDLPAMTATPVPHMALHYTKR